MAKSPKSKTKSTKVKKADKPQPRIRAQTLIVRQNLRDNPDTIYVFGDNIARAGFGGQAAEMRDEPNALGVITKRRPLMTDEAFLAGTPTDLYHFMNSLTDLAYFNAHKKNIVLPAAGIGTERAQLETRAPRLHKILKHFMKALLESESHAAQQLARQQLSSGRGTKPKR